VLQRDIILYLAGRQWIEPHDEADILRHFGLREQRPVRATFDTFVEVGTVNGASSNGRRRRIRCVVAGATWESP
jgi:hypothetical protein